ncbi:LacI family DNA-binding transcriptional regulator [Laceyella putida]|uniref:LacI family DNA-binding transcriptional regulator n=1 Tax=Laceyella putida TaxID=110101 RepID=A0ABW2RNY4_9BACL
MATMKDVAKLAGVSIITVSRVINSPQLVKESTRQKVKRVMEETGFIPNQTAKALVSNQTRTIHIMIPESHDISDPFIMTLVSGVASQLSKEYYSFLIRRDWEFPYRCDGVIIMGLNLGQEQEIKQKLPHTPCVLFGQTEAELDWVDIDNRKGGYLATKHLIEQGHREIGFLKIDEPKRFPIDRYQGYLDALTEAGIPLDESLVCTVKNSEEDGFQKSLAFIEQRRMTAIFASNDATALGVLRAARKCNRKVPEELSVVGFDGLFLDQIADPRLTTIHQPIFEVGEHLAAQMVRRIELPDHELLQRLVEPKLVERETVQKKNVGQ